MKIKNGIQRCRDLTPLSVLCDDTSAALTELILDYISVTFCLKISCLTSPCVMRFTQLLRRAETFQASLTLGLCHMGRIKKSTKEIRLSFCFFTGRILHTHAHTYIHRFIFQMQQPSEGSWEWKCSWKNSWLDLGGSKDRETLMQANILETGKKRESANILSLVLLGDKMICPVKKWGRAFFYRSHPASVSLFQASIMPLSQYWHSALF